MVVKRGKTRKHVTFMAQAENTQKIPISRNMFSLLPDLVPEGPEGNLTTTGLEGGEGELEVQGEEHAPACSRVNSKKNQS